LPHRFDVEAYAGLPVKPGLATDRAGDWVAGGRVARRLGNYGSVGLAFLEQRDAGQLATEELGADAGFAIDKHDDLGARIAYDIANPGIAEIGATASRRKKSLRTDVYATYRAASHLLPATSLFTVLGATPAMRAGAMVSGKLFPRLEVSGDAGVRYLDGDAAPSLMMRTRLLLDERGTSALTGELRRDGIGDDAWTGARGAARIALPHALTASTEIELVIPDTDRGRGRAWPWALAALGWEHGAWNAAVAVEASSSPEYVRRLDALLQLGRRWGIP
jgi:hypothetical protein